MIDFLKKLFSGAASDELNKKVEDAKNAVNTVTDPAKAADAVASISSPTSKGGGSSQPTSAAG